MKAAAGRTGGINMGKELWRRLKIGWRDIDTEEETNGGGESQRVGGRDIGREGDT
jgi:hypothetical protein